MTETPSPPVRTIAEVPGLKTGLLILAVCSLLASVAWIWVGVSTVLVPGNHGPLLTRGGNEVLGSDFVAFYATAVQVLRGAAAAAYRPEVLQAVQKELLGLGVFLPWMYPPTFMLVVAPLGLLPYLTALAAWIAFGLVLVTGAVWLVVRHPLALLAPLCTPLAQAWMFGQNGPLSAALLTAGLALLQSQPVLAGVCFGLLGYKPQLVLLIPLALLAGGYFRTLAVMVATGAAVALVSLLVLGLDPWREFLFSALARGMGYALSGAIQWDRAPTVLVAVRHASGSAGLAQTAQTVSTLCAAAAVLFVWRYSRDSAWRAVVLAVALPLATPFAYDYDMAVLIAPIAFLVATQQAGGVTVPRAALVGVLWLSTPLIWLWSHLCRLQVAPVLWLAIVAGVVIAVAQARRRQAPI